MREIGTAVAVNGEVLGTRANGGGGGSGNGGSVEAEAGAWAALQHGDLLSIGRFCAQFWQPAAGGTPPVVDSPAAALLEQLLGRLEQWGAVDRPGVRVGHAQLLEAVALELEQLPTELEVELPGHGLHGVDRRGAGAVCCISAAQQRLQALA